MTDVKLTETSNEYRIEGYPFDKSFFNALKESGDVRYTALGKGQLFEECFCGEEPVCVDCQKCATHCRCGASYWTITPLGILKVLKNHAVFVNSIQVDSKTTNIEDALKKVKENLEKQKMAKDEEKRIAREELKKKEVEFEAINKKLHETHVVLSESFRSYEKINNPVIHASPVARESFTEISVNGNPAWLYYGDIGFGDDIRINVLVDKKTAHDVFLNEKKHLGANLVVEGIIKFFSDIAKKMNLHSNLECYGCETLRYLFSNNLVTANEVRMKAKEMSDAYLADDRNFSYINSAIPLEVTAWFLYLAEDTITDEALKLQVNKRFDEVNAKRIIEDEKRKAKILKEAANREKEKIEKRKKILADLAGKTKIEILDANADLVKRELIRKSWDKEKLVNMIVEIRVSGAYDTSSSRKKEEECYEGPDVY